MPIDRDEPASVDVDASRLEPKAVTVGNRSDRQNRMRAVHDPAIVTVHDDRVAVALDRCRPRTLQ
jgi:hypothetical protein